MIKYELKWAKYVLYCIINKGIKKIHSFFLCWGWAWFRLCTESCQKCMTHLLQSFFQDALL